MSIQLSFTKGNKTLENGRMVLHCIMGFVSDGHSYEIRRGYFLSMERSAKHKTAEGS